MERRKYPRYKIDTAAEVRYRNTTIDAKAIEISAHGVRIESTSMIRPGTKVDVTLFLREPERFSGEVEWIIAEHGQETVNYKIGIYCEEGGLISNNEP